MAMNLATPGQQLAIDPLPRDVDVLVIGGGVIGVTSAWYLAQRGRTVTLVDKDDVCAGSSYGNSGLLVPSHSRPLAAPGVLAQGLRWLLDSASPFYVKPRLDRDLLAWLWKFRGACTAENVRRAVPVLRDLSYASLALYRELAAIPGFDFGLRQDGALMVFRTKARLDEHRHEAETLQAAGISARVLDENGARELEPALRPDIAGAVYFPEDAHLTPDRFVRGLARLAQERGVTVMPSTEVLGFERSGRRIAAIETTRGAVRASEVVLAAGSWSPALGRQLGVRLPIQPAKGYSVTCDAPPGGPRLPMLLGEARFAVTPMGDALRFGGTLELAGLDLTINRVRVDAIQRGWRDYLAVPGELRLRQIWRGLRPCTPDGLPLLGRPRALDNLVVATGHAMIGVSLGPITGKLVTEIVAGEKPGVDIAALDPDRFG